MLGDPRESRPATGGSGPALTSPGRAITDGRLSGPSDGASQPRRTRPTLILRGRRHNEHASCLDCDQRWSGKGTRKLAGMHAVRRNHRVTFVRYEYGELRRRRWPAT